MWINIPSLYQCHTTVSLSEATETSSFFVVIGKTLPLEYVPYKRIHFMGIGSVSAEGI